MINLRGTTAVRPLVHGELFAIGEKTGNPSKPSVVGHAHGGVLAGGIDDVELESWRSH
jgi:hypothetical protein